MEQGTKIHVGLDVHKDSITVAAAEPGRDKARVVGKVVHDVYSRAGTLTPVWIPELEDEAIRDLSRAREDAVNQRTQVRQQLKGFLLRHDRRYGGRPPGAVRTITGWPDRASSRLPRRRPSPSTG